MQSSLIFAGLAGLCWGGGGYFEKMGLKALGMPPWAGITVRTVVALIPLFLLSLPAWQKIQHPGNLSGWLMLIVGGGIVAGVLGNGGFYLSLVRTENLGVTLAIAFAMAPVAGTAIGLLAGTQQMDWRSGMGILAIIGGTALVQLGRT